MTTDSSLQDSQLAPRADERRALALRAQRMRRVNRATLALPALGFASGAWLLARGREGRSAGLAALGASLGFGLVRWQLQRWVTESVPFDLRATLGDIEVRAYPPQVWAETVVEKSTWNDALREGFQRLAAYIFGANNEAARLTMTAPVLSSCAPTERSPERLSMTAPVLAEVGAPDQQLDRTIAFVMPADRDLDTLPAPHDLRVRLREVPERLVAALRFRGNYESGLPHQKREELLRRLREAGLEPRGEPHFAGYDPPSTWAALRRNEVLVELANTAMTQRRR
jgi:hypothetical protein